MLALAPGGSADARDAWSRDDDSVTLAPALRFEAGAMYGGPIGLAAAGGLIYGLGADIRDDEQRVRGVLGVLAEVEAGASGGKVGLGLAGRARVDADDWRGSLAIALKLSLARRWDRAGAGGATYLGPELALGVQHVGLSLGPLWRVHGDGGGRLIFSWGMGLRL